ncbi:MAG TPA: hypothetical protein VHW43_11940, partial [Puia sp.]|nr:hypothetical protein [Puia sp.]
MPTNPQKWLFVFCLLPAQNLLAQQDSAAASPFHKILTEVTVTGKGPTLRNGPEKKVFAVNQSLVSLGGSAADLLQNVPTLQ